MGGRFPFSSFGEEEVHGHHGMACLGGCRELYVGDYVGKD